MNRPATVSVRAPAKINLYLSVAPPAADGFHALSTVFSAVSLYDEVRVSDREAGAGIELRVSGPQAGGLPADESNLVHRSTVLLAEHVGRAPDVTISVDKQIPLAAGLAGGSADAAGTLVALDSLWGLGLDRTALAELAGQLGSDVPFCVHGGLALGSGRGDRLSAVLARGRFDWVLGFAPEGLSTPAVYAELDRLRAARRGTAIDGLHDVLTAVRHGDPDLLAATLGNDLQPAALSLRPELRPALRAGAEAGTLGQLVSGSGPTMMFLARDGEHAVTAAAQLSGAGVFTGVKVVHGPVPGPRAHRLPG